MIMKNFWGMTIQILSFMKRLKEGKEKFEYNNFNIELEVVFHEKDYTYDWCGKKYFKRHL